MPSIMGMYLAGGHPSWMTKWRWVSMGVTIKEDHDKHIIGSVFLSIGK